jgi:hypothetical protein
MGALSSDEPSYIKLDGTLQSPDCNPTRQQRAVWRFYESRNSFEADDIYSPEWYQRTLSFFKKFAGKSKKPKILGSWKMIENLEFGPFFLSQPIAAYALWHMLQAFYDLDHAVCGTSDDDVETIEKWKEIPPFVYLNTRNGKEGKKVRAKWNKSLEQMKKEIECGALEGEALISRLASILVAVKKMGEAFDAMKENFAENLNGMAFVDEMIEKVGVVVEERKQVIGDLLKSGDENGAPTSDTEASNDGIIGMSSQDSAGSCSDWSEDLSSSYDPSPVERRISLGEQTFPNLRRHEDSSQSVARHGKFTSKQGVTSTDQCSDTMIFQLLDILVTAVKVSMSCIFIYLALWYLIKVQNLYKIQQLKGESRGLWVIFILVLSGI